MSLLHMSPVSMCAVPRGKQLGDGYRWPIHDIAESYRLQRANCNRWVYQVILLFAAAGPALPLEVYPHFEFIYPRGFSFFVFKTELSWVVGVITQLSFLNIGFP